ncbi:MAG: IclR family transcriptional regulator [Pseudomonadota bacterium]
MNSATGIQVISRAAQILRELKTDNSGQSLGELATQTGLPRSTVQRIVNALIVEGFVTTSGKDGDLRLGPEVQALAAAGRVDITVMMRPWLEQLAEETGETVDLARFDGTHMTFVDQVAGRNRLSAVSVPGLQFPLVNTANGKAVLALLPKEEVNRLCAINTPGKERNALLEELRETRTSGLALDLDDHTPGISAAGIAFRTVGGEVFAVSIPAPSERFIKKRKAITQALESFRTAAIASTPYFLA